MTVSGATYYTVCPFSRHKGKQRPKCLQNKAQMHLSRNCPFSDMTNLPLELPGWGWGSLPFFLGQKSCRTKVPRILRIFIPNFAPNFAPNCPRIFRGLFVLRFMGDGDQKKIHQKSPPFFNAKFPGKHEKNIHKILLESRQSNFFQLEKRFRRLQFPVPGEFFLMHAVHGRRGNRASVTMLWSLISIIVNPQ